MVRAYDTGVERAIESMHRQYRTLLRNDTSFSLRELFSSPAYDIAEMSASFRPNRFGPEACWATEQFCRAHRIWLENGDDYNSMTPYLHPGAIDAERMTIIGIFNAILFWLNDTIGREKFGHLSPSKQNNAHVTVARLSQLFGEHHPPADPTDLESAVIRFLEMLTRSADPAWVDRFLRLTEEHLLPALRDQNARTRGSVLPIADYIDLRNQISGMCLALALCEFGRDSYLPWGRITSSRLGGALRRLRLLTVEIGGLMNDVFSFEKECIADRADFNLIPIVLLNSADNDLSDAIFQACEIVRRRVIAFSHTKTRLIDAADAAPDRDLGARIATHVADLTSCVQATWVWQNATPRYKGKSIFAENQTLATSGNT
ncbi:terpene synthase [Nocardia sp. NPDC057030]|uniref:terpene synthase family protein n=1 Tax=unclassified Nocardia TaxID=2637762 RepID=UPI00363B0C6B